MKIRTDFVTNSSSSSFLLVIRVNLKNGKTISFSGDGGVGEDFEKYYQLAALSSPEELGTSSGIDEMIDKLRMSVVEEKQDPKTGQDVNKPIFSVSHPFITQISKLESMDEISSITINGDLIGREEEHQYWHYTYYRDRGILVFDEGGEDFNSEGTGGRIGFFASKSAYRGRQYGQYAQSMKARAYKRDVEIDEDEIVNRKEAMARKEKEDMALLAEYNECLRSIKYTTDISNPFPGCSIGCNLGEASMGEHMASIYAKYGWRYVRGFNIDNIISRCDGFLVLPIDRAGKDAVAQQLRGPLGPLARLKGLKSYMDAGHQLMVLNEDTLEKYLEKYPPLSEDELAALAEERAARKKALEEEKKRVQEMKEEQRWIKAEEKRRQSDERRRMLAEQKQRKAQARMMEKQKEKEEKERFINCTPKNGQVF